MALRKGVSKCEKKNKKRVDKGEPSTDKDRTASDSGKRGETEQMWDSFQTIALQNQRKRKSCVTILWP